MMTLIPRNSLSWDFHIMENGRAIAYMDRHWYHERASFSLDATSYMARRTSRLRGTFILEHSGLVLAEAKQMSWFRRAFIVADGADEYVLRATSFPRRQFDLLHAGARVGTVRPISMLRRTAVADFPADIHRPVQLFMVFLVLVSWKRRYDSAGA